MPRSRPLIVLLALVSLALCSLAAGVATADPDAGGKVVFPGRYADGVMYATLDRPAKDDPAAPESPAQSRKYYATASAIKALRNGEPIPSGSVITMVKYGAALNAQGEPLRHDNGRFIRGELLGFSVMEKRTAWAFQDFTADGRPKLITNRTACVECHRSQEKTDFLFTWQKIKAAFAK
jgi:hypothetical protein